MQFTFLMAAACQSGIFMDLSFVSKGYHSLVALVSSESLCPFQLTSSFQSLGNHPVVSLSNLLCILSQGTSVYQKRGVRCYSRPLAPNSSTGNVCSGVANTENAAPCKIVNMGSVICLSSGSCIHGPPSHSQRVEPSVFWFVIHHWALPACISQRSGSSPLGRQNDSSGIFK